MSYPPPGPPPAPPRQTQPHRALWIAIIAAAIPGVLALALAALWIFTPFFLLGESFSDDDYYGSSDDYYVSSDAANQAMSEHCDAIDSAAQDVMLFAGPEDGSRSLAALADRMRDLSTALTDASTNKSTQALSDDWLFLADAVDGYAEALGDVDGAPEPLDLTDGGTWVPDRIEWSNDSCYAPAIVDALGKQDLREPW